MTNLEKIELLVELLYIRCIDYVTLRHEKEISYILEKINSCDYIHYNNLEICYHKKKIITLLELCEDKRMSLIEYTNYIIKNSLTKEVYDYIIDEFNKQFKKYSGYDDLLNTKIIRAINLFNKLNDVDFLRYFLLTAIDKEDTVLNYLNKLFCIEKCRI